ncbi:MAG: primosomal protein N' [Flavobacteriales bacterium]|nr:MAG: primosomal protein N' [Flavobacteriales bacterium]
MAPDTKFIDVILPLAVPKTYTYRIPFELNDLAEKGKRVVVQFGKSKLYSALIKNIHKSPPQDYTAKYIDSILDENPVVNEKQFELWEWMSAYYLCTIGEVMNAALPRGLKLSSETRIVFNEDFGNDYSSLNDEEFLLLEALEKNHMLCIEDVCAILDKKTVYPVIKSLIEKGAVVVEEELKERYKPKIVQYVKLWDEFHNEEKLKNVFDDLNRAPKQLELLMAYIDMSRHYSENPIEVKKIELQKRVNATATVVNQLVKKGVFEVIDKHEGRLISGEKTKGLVELSKPQQKAFDSIKVQFEKKDAVLLHGVTSSGKTEIYVKLIEETIKQGKQVLYLLPEIALTTQIIKRLQKYFGDKIGVYHSKFNVNERVEVWNGLQVRNHSTKREEVRNFQIILGARSALFLPFSKLGLVIVDEEHENSFKQYNPAPRYQARDAAIVLAKIHGAKTLLGSATPSIESYRNARNEKFGLVELKERFGDVQLPEIFVADIKEAARKKQMKSHFSPMLMEEMETALGNNEQIILFQNRRGFSPFMQCETCVNIPQCKKCDVSLTYHKYFNELRCHYCGYRISLPKTCIACGDTNLKLKGFGTEKIEEELPVFFPEAKVARMDLDTTRSKNAYQRIITEFEEGAIDILVGTQMVTKGLDFDNVTLVGILNADNMLGFPDFRAFERSFQLMAQVSGRAGRKKKRGKVIIQTMDPYHTIIQQVIPNDYQSMYENEIYHRKNFSFPPFCRLIELTLRHRDIQKVNAAADFFSKNLRKKFGKRVLGPEFPVIPRIRNLYNKNILLKIEKDISLKKVKILLQDEIVNFKSDNEFKSVRVSVDVDPM